MATVLLDKIDGLIEYLDEYKQAGDSLINNAFVIVTKWPTKGKSKTRLSACIGADLAIEFSLSALKDLLLYYCKLSDHKKFLLFAPKDAESKFKSLLNEINLMNNNEYNLVCMRDSNLKTSNLGNKLSGCIQDLRKEYNINGSICFIGSDCLELRIKNIMNAKKYTNLKNAYIIPANDGGYVMIDLPSNASHKVFDNVLWSNQKTCQSQIEQIKKCGINCIKCEQILADVDEMQDWLRLCDNFGIKWNNNKHSDNDKHKHIDDKKSKSVESDKSRINDYRKLYPHVAALLLKSSGIISC